MLYEFITENRSALIDRCRALVEQRSSPTATPSERESGLPLFLDQLAETLQLEQRPDSKQALPGAGGGDSNDDSAIERAARKHGRFLSQQGFSAEEVVRNYGDVCQAITGLAVESDAALELEEFQTLNRCLDIAIAGAVAEFVDCHDAAESDKGTQASNERLGYFAHELRNLLHTATLALSAMRGGTVGANGATGELLARSLVRLGTLIDRSLAEVRVTARMPPRSQQVPLEGFFAEVKLAASLDARTYGCTMVIGEMERGLGVVVDREILNLVVANLLQNAFKFSRPSSEIVLSARVSGERVLIEVTDQCGGLAPGLQETIFLPFTQSNADKSGVGLGLTLSKRSIEANHGTLSLRNLPGTGCVFTIDLPRAATA